MDHRHINSFFFFVCVFSGVCVLSTISAIIFPFHALIILHSQSSENEDDTLHNPTELDSSTILNECKKDLSSKRRPSLAQKMTSNLRRLSGAADLKIDINDPQNANNSKYCNKKIKVSAQVPLSFVRAIVTRGEVNNFHFAYDSDTVFTV